MKIIFSSIEKKTDNPHLTLFWFAAVQSLFGIDRTWRFFFTEIHTVYDDHARQGRVGYEFYLFGDTEIAAVIRTMISFSYVRWLSWNIIILYAAKGVNARRTRVDEWTLSEYWDSSNVV